MTNPNANPNPPNPVNPNTAPKGNAAIDHTVNGLMLQRGGEELVLEKLDDRFTVTATTKDEVPQLATQVAAEITKNRLPKMSEFVVNPDDRDAAMETMRQSDLVQYASHIYQFKDDPASRVYLTNRLTIQFAANLKAEAIAAITTPLGLTQIKPIVGLTNAYVYELASASENPVKVANALIQRPEVLAAEPNIVVPTQSHYRPKDSQYPKQWHLNHNGGNQLTSGSHVFAEQAWDITKGSRSIVVAVADDGMDLKHPDFQGIGKIVSPRDFKGKDFLPMPEDADENHGRAI
jgi:subtilisin family serine protease